MARSFLQFAALAYGISWAFWALPILLPDTTVGQLGFYGGGFGPMLAALIIVHHRGQALWPWVKGWFRWRVSPWWYAFVLLFPALLMAIASGLLALRGVTISFDLLTTRLAQYAPTLVGLALIGGGNEEPGWRGFGLPALQDGLQPLPATLILGLVWALWHLPLLGMDPAAFDLPLSDLLTRVGLLLVSITAHAFWYTWIINRTGSVLLCVLLHAGYNATNGLLLLIPASNLHGEVETLMLPIMTAVVVASALSLTLATRGRLGQNRNGATP